MKGIIVVCPFLKSQYIGISSAVCWRGFRIFFTYLKTINDKIATPCIDS